MHQSSVISCVKLVDVLQYKIRGSCITVKAMQRFRNTLTSTTFLTAYILLWTNGTCSTLLYRRQKKFWVTAHIHIGYYAGGGTRASINLFACRVVYYTSAMKCTRRRDGSHCENSSDSTGRLKDSQAYSGHPNDAELMTECGQHRCVIWLSKMASSRHI